MVHGGRVTVPDALTVNALHRAHGGSVVEVIRLPALGNSRVRVHGNLSWLRVHRRSSLRVLLRVGLRIGLRMSLRMRMRMSLGMGLGMSLRMSLRVCLGMRLARP